MKKMFQQQRKSTIQKWENYYKHYENQPNKPINHLKDHKVPQPLNLTAVKWIHCISCGKNHPIQEATQHVQPNYHYIEQPKQSESYQNQPFCQCGDICGQTQTMKPVQQPVNQYKVPYVNSKKLVDNRSNDFQTMINEMPQKEKVHELQPIYQEISYEKKHYKINPKKAVYYKSQYVDLEEDEHYDKKAFGFIGPRKKKDAKIYYGYQVPQKKTEFVKVNQSYPDTGTQQQVDCGNFCQSEMEGQKKKIIKKQKYNIYPQKKRQSHFQFNKNGRVVQDTNSFQQISVIQSQSPYYDQEQNFLCECKVYVNCCGACNQTRPSSKHYAENQYISNKGFWTPKRQICFVGNTSQHACPLCNGTNVCSYCNNKISDQLANKIKQSVIKLQQDKFIEKNENQADLQDWKIIWKKIRTWETKFNQQAFNLCQKDAKSKGVKTLKQWQQYVSCDMFH